MKSPEFVVPEIAYFDEKLLVAFFMEVRKTLKEPIATAGLNQVCEAFAFGEIDRF